MNRSDIERQANTLLRQMQVRRVEDLSQQAMTRGVVEGLGYEFVEVESLDWPPGLTATAYGGLIDRQAKRIAVATRFGSEVKRFTAMHEVGHLILHSAYQDRLHRDIPISGSKRSTSRPKIEREADAFAGYFLMPRRLLEKHMELRFGVPNLLNVNWSEALAFHLAPKGHHHLLAGGKQGLRARSLAIATAQCLSGRFFTSMAHTFGVSSTALAIQLEITDLVN